MAAASTLVLSGMPSPATQGAAFNVTVTARDPHGNVATGYSGTVHVTSTDGAAVLPANFTLVNGVGTFAVTFNTLGNQTLTITDTANSSISGSATVGVAPIAPSNLAATVVSGRQIMLTWTDNSSTETGINVERSTDGIHWTVIASLGPNATSYLDSGLRKHATYYYRVVAFYTNPDLSILYSAYSGVVNATARR